MSAFTSPPEHCAKQTHERQLGGGPVAAAVLVALYEHEGRVHTVLTRRRSDLRRHAGEISFPGGRRDPEDSDLRQTALREADEEIGLPSSQVTPMGELPATSTIATNYIIHPLVGAIPAGLAWTLSPREVDAVIEPALADIRAARTVARLQRRGMSFLADAYVVDGNLIWGATARILEQLLLRVADEAPLPTTLDAAPPGL